MDVVGVALCAAGTVVGVVHAVQDTRDWRTLHRLQRSGLALQGSVVDNESYRRLDVRLPLQRPVVLYRVDGRSYRQPVINHLGAAPVDSGLDVLVDPADPYVVAASGPNDARNQLLISLALTAIIVVVGILLLGASTSGPGL